MASQSRKIRRDQERRQKDGGVLDIVEYFEPGKNELIVRRWELLLVLAYVQRKHRTENRWWKVLWRFLTRKPFLRFDFFRLLEIELERRARERADQLKAN